MGSSLAPAFNKLTQFLSLLIRGVLLLCDLTNLRTMNKHAPGCVYTHRIFGGLVRSLRASLFFLFPFSVLSLVGCASSPMAPLVGLGQQVIPDVRETVLAIRAVESSSGRSIEDIRFARMSQMWGRFQVRNTPISAGLDRNGACYIVLSDEAEHSYVLQDFVSGAPNAHEIRLFIAAHELTHCLFTIDQAHSAIKGLGAPDLGAVPSAEAFADLLALSALKRQGLISDSTVNYIFGMRSGKLGGSEFSYGTGVLMTNSWLNAFAANSWG